MGYDGVGVRICVPAEENRAGERERKFDIEKEVGVGGRPRRWGGRLKQAADISSLSVSRAWL